MQRQRHSLGAETSRPKVSFQPLSYPLTFQTKHKSQANLHDSSLANQKLDALLQTFGKISVALENGLAAQNTKTNQFCNTLSQSVLTKMEEMISVNKTISQGIHKLVKMAEKPEKSQEQIQHKVIQPEVPDSQIDFPQERINQSPINPESSNWLSPIITDPPNIDKLITQKIANHYGRLEEEKDEMLNRITETYSRGESGEKYLNLYFGKFYSQAAEHYFKQYKHGELSYQDMKIQFSYDLLSQLVDLSRRWNQVYYSTGELENNFEKQMFVKISYVEHLNKALKNTLKYLIYKYPPSRNKIVDTSLSEKIKTTKHFSPVEHDMLRRAGIKLGLVDGQTNFNKDIKIWINMLIKETDSQFPRFKDTMKRIFIGRESSFQEDVEDVEYLIGRKIQEGASLYTQEEIELEGLEVNNPQVLRILMKWCQELGSYFTDTQSKIFNNKYGFKNRSLDVPIRLPRSRLDILAQKLSNSYAEIVKEVGQCERTWMGVLFLDTLNLGTQGIREGYEFLNEKQVTVLKISQYLNQSLKSFAVAYLNYYLTQLTKIRSTYAPDKLESNLNLVTFGIMDLLRCKCVASKAQIYRIYKEITENTEYFEVIRIKNKLNEPTRDILINLKLKNSFLICEVQLSLGDSKEQANNDFCHYLYELERSQFSVVYECASQISNLDPKMAYIKKQKQLKLQGNPVLKQTLQNNTKVIGDQIHCWIGHESVPMDIRKNQDPFVCHLCASYVRSYTTCLYFAHCNKCHTSICSLCIMQFYNHQSLEFLTKYISRFIECQHSVMFFQDFLEQSVVEPSVMKKSVQKHITENNYIIHMIVNQKGHLPVLYKKFKKQIIPAFSTLDKLKPQTCSNSICWNFIAQAKPHCVRRIQELKGYMKYHMVLEWCDLEKLLEERGVEQVVCVVSEENKSVLVIDMIETEDEVVEHKMKKQMERVVGECNEEGRTEIEFTSKQLRSIEWMGGVREKGEIKSVNFWENEIEDISLLQEFPSLSNIILRQNKIKGMVPLVSLVHAEYLMLSENQIEGELPTLSMPSLRILDVYQNPICSISNLTHSNLNSLIILRMGYLKGITSLPLITAPKLITLLFQHNQIADISTLSQSTLTSLIRIKGNNNNITTLTLLENESVQQILLADNRIERIGQFIRSKCDNLRRLDLSNNRIRGELPSLSGFGGLKELILSNNMIETFQDQVINMKSLQKLDVSHNNLKHGIPTILCESLMQLNLSNNSLGDLLNLSHSTLPSLTILNLDNNSLQQLPPLHLPQLKQLHLSHNLLSTLQTMNQWRLPKLQRMSLCHNNIQGTIPTVYFQNLIELDITSNNLSDLEFVGHLHLLKKLKRVIICQNQQLITKYKEHSTLFVFQREDKGDGGIQGGVRCRRFSVASIRE